MPCSRDILPVSGEWRTSHVASLGLFAMLAVACSASNIKPRYANTEPTTEQIPAISPEVALGRLERSRLYWKLASRMESQMADGIRHTSQLAAPQHSYVRAVQTDESHIELTYVSVEGGRAVVRALGAIEPSHLFSAGNAATGKSSENLRQLWKEVDGEVGAHGEGASALSIDALYDQCVEEIRRPGAGPIRLYFHPSGVLMHCGRTKSECSECKTVSIHNYATHSIGPWARDFDASKWACAEPWGLVLLGAPSWLRGPRSTCEPQPLAAEAKRMRRMAQEPVCSIDPATCPTPNTTPTISLGLWPSGGVYVTRRPLQYLEVGKADPDEQLAVMGPGGEIRPVKRGDTRYVPVGTWPELLERYNVTGAP